MDSNESTPNPLAAWLLDGDGEDSVGDSPLTFSGGVELGADAVAFDGASGFGATRAPGPITTADSFAVAAWVNLQRRPEPDTAPAAVSQLGEVAAAFFLGYADGSWSFSMKDDDTNEPGHTSRAVAPRTQIDPASWVHLVGVFDADAGQIRLYVDGEPSAETPFHAAWQADGPLTVARAQAHGTAADFWPGAVADVGVYALALADAQVAALFGKSRPESSPPAVPEPPDAFVCPPHGGACLGPLAAGTYTTTVFSPAITYTVADGWSNGEDLLGNFLLQREGDQRYLGIYRNVAAPFGCQESPDPQVGSSVEALSTWLLEHPGLDTEGPTPVSVGGLDGVYLDISLDPSWEMTCPFSAGQPVVPFIIGGGTSSLHHVILPGFEERLYLLTYDDDNIAIEIGPEGESLQEYLTEVEPIIETLHFGP